MCVHIDGISCLCLLDAPPVRVQVQGKGGRFFCLSSLHVTGEQLHQLGGVAAILRFPLEIDAEEEEEPIDLVRQQGGIGISSASVSRSIVLSHVTWCV